MQFLLTDGLEEIAIITPGEASSLPATGDARALAFDDADSAWRLLRRCATERATLAGLRRLEDESGRRYLSGRSDRSADERLLRTLAGAIARGSLMLIARNRIDLARPIPAAPAQTPLDAELARPSLPPAAPAPPTERKPPQETMVPAPIAQAATLEAAATSGAPLCET